MMEQVAISINDATIKHAQTIGMTQGTQQKLKTLLKINISAKQLQWDQYLNIAVTAYNTSYRASLKCAPAEIFHGRTYHSELDLKFLKLFCLTNQPTDISNTLDEFNENHKQNVNNIVVACKKKQNIL